MNYSISQLKEDLDARTYTNFFDEYNYFDTTYSVSALKHLSDDELVERLFCSKFYAEKKGVPVGYTTWAEHGAVGETASPFGSCTETKYIGVLAQIEKSEIVTFCYYDYTKKGAPIVNMDKTDAIACAKNVRDAFRKCVNLVDTKKPKSFKDYESLLEDIKKYLKGLGFPYLHCDNSGNPNAFFIKYLHCSCRDYFVPIYSRKLTGNILRKIGYTSHDSAFLNNSQICIAAKDILGSKTQYPTAEFDRLLLDRKIYDEIKQDDNRESDFKTWLKTQVGENTAKTYISHLNQAYKVYKYSNYESVFFIDDQAVVRTYMTNALKNSDFTNKNISGNKQASNCLEKYLEYLSLGNSGIRKGGHPMSSVTKSNIKKIGKNTILYGPPGTGKTYSTAIYAVAICDYDGDVSKVPSDYKAVMNRFNALKDKEHRVDFTIFHQSYGYEEFIEGIKPVMNKGKSSSNVEYTIKDGVFKRFCSKAGKDENGKSYVFVIDEINRGNISKIFGELITLIEETKRANEDEMASAILPCSDESFSVPSNVYILGTMNTADRSIALIDTALRRRFQFVEMMPAAQVLRDIGAASVSDGDVTLDVAAMLEKINERIMFLYDREHTIGHAFFTSLRDDPSIENLAGIFSRKVIPLLQEYFYEDYQKIQLVLGDNSKSNDSFKFIKDSNVVVSSVFKGSPEDVITLPVNKYEINTEAFGKIQSYTEIM